MLSKRQGPRCPSSSTHAHAYRRLAFCDSARGSRLGRESEAAFLADASIFVVLHATYWTQPHSNLGLALAAAFTRVAQKRPSFSKRDHYGGNVTPSVMDGSPNEHRKRVKSERPPTRAPRHSLTRLQTLAAGTGSRAIPQNKKTVGNNIPRFSRFEAKRDACGRQLAHVRHALRCSR